MDLPNATDVGQEVSQVIPLCETGYVRGIPQANIYNSLRLRTPQQIEEFFCAFLREPDGEDLHAPSPSTAMDICGRE